MIYKLPMEPHKPKILHYEIACQQVLEEGYSVFSIQWVVIPGNHAVDMTTDKLMHLYLSYIRYFTVALVQPVVTGDCIEFRFMNSGISLLKFSSPLYEKTSRGTRAMLRIAGGVLVQPRQCDRGELEFRVEQIADGTKLTLQLSDYCPLLLGSTKPSTWRKWLYRLTQAYIHKVVTVRFLARVFRSIEGYTPMSTVVKVSLRQGEEI